MRLLAADIGGTHTRLILADWRDHQRQTIAEHEYSSREFSDFLSLAQQFLSSLDQKINIDVACIAVAGPVREQCVKVTNLPWKIDASQLSRQLKIPSLVLINDFAAVGYAVHLLAASDFVTLQEGIADSHACCALMGAGTGLGQAILVPQDGNFLVLATEGGNAGFAPDNALQIELLRSLLQQYPHVETEKLLSGPGLVRIYQFLRNSIQCTESDELSQALQREGDAAATISHYAMAGKNKIAAAALDCFIDIYGSQAGNLALNCLATGGVYLAGGIAGKILPKLENGNFMRAFRNKGNMSQLVENIPVKVIINHKAGLLGALEYAKLSAHKIRLKKQQ